jgi:hypothetical protein
MVYELDTALDLSLAERDEAKRHSASVANTLLTHYSFVQAPGDPADRLNLLVGLWYLI